MEELQEIKIIYEDNHLLVVEKPINIPVQEDESGNKDLLTLLKNYRKRHENKPREAYVGLVHRLDRPVSGVMVFAKTSKAAERLSKQIREHTFKKIYYAVVSGNLKENDTLTDYLIKDRKTNTSYVTTKNNGKIAILDYKVIAKKKDLNLIKINLQTGRSHQIRVQFASRGNPLIGDNRYNKNPIVKEIALFAKEISFMHPITKENLTFSLDLPNRYPFNIF